ncbi:hypothetical protein ACVW00_000307 [Marmoricola sp. URHA0025 HA25]
MGLESWQWRFWDQSTAVDNARAASLELAGLRTERDEVDAYVVRLLAGRRDTRSA